MSAKVFIVTGASKGIGAAVARHLLGQSHKVVLAARSTDLLEKIKKEYPGQVEYVAGDMTSPDMPKNLTSLAVTAFGKLDGLVINHGVLYSEKFGKISLDEFKKSYDVNVFSYLAMAQAALAELRKSKGCVVWISSGAANKPYGGWCAYGSSKAAINSILQHMAREEPEITSVGISPGRVDTGMQEQIRSAGEESMDKAQYDDFVNVFEQGKLFKPEQPGNVVAKLVANPDKDLSGQIISFNSSELSSYQV